MAPVYSQKQQQPQRPTCCCCCCLAAYPLLPLHRRRLQALHLLAAMCEGGTTLAPDGVSYNTAIKACAAACQVDQALEVYRQMVGR